MSLEDELRELIINKYRSIRQFSIEANIPATTIQSMLNSGIQNAGVKKVMRICDILGLETDALADGYIKEKVVNSNSITVNELNLIKKYRALDEHGKDMVDTVLQKEYERRTEHAKEFIMLQPPLLVPYYGHVASAGTGQYVFDDIPPEMIEIENEMDNMHVDFAIGVNGDSMKPTYHDGDTLLIKKQSEICVGEIGIFMINGEAFVKELGDGVLISHNKKYKDIHINDSVICLGKVISKHIS
ncbi:hypothetical protein CIAN88_15525 [[Clostridium] innocuum]|uniref:HTH cro/C1-type domain-containing protein n=1 Tax=Clostridium innocuum TaxID=1522 RepID=A0A099I651_CLOIN|nr:S24 family peptidase [[Clostridium] innocuum]KGJ52343.1 hypothetical protein CIAN88_15525 [[Clostridium] innocuum]